MDFSKESEFGFQPRNAPKSALELLELINRFPGLFYISVVDFFTLGGFSKLPEEWQSVIPSDEVVEGASDPFINDLIQATGNGNPNVLLFSICASAILVMQSNPFFVRFNEAYFQHTLRLQRELFRKSWPESLSNMFRQGYQLPLHKVYHENLPKKSSSIEPRFQIRMSPKKQHEVGIMAALVGKFAAAHQVETVVDLGSGQGYLSRLLAYQHGLNVLGVDGDPAQSAGAYRIDAQFSKRSKRVPGELSHSTLLISPASLPQLQGDIVKFNGQKDWLLCGLHTCGLLAYTTIDLFFKTDAKCLVTVACCYNRLTEGEEFPTSNFLKERSPSLGRLALKMACQTPSAWPSNPGECFEFFKRHFYRALLQKLMVEVGHITATQLSPTIGKLKKDSFVSFQVYARAALVQLGYPVPEPEELQAFYEKHRTGYRQIALVWSLQSALAPVIESLLILDRYISIKERLGPPGDVSILPMFDLSVSPRCFALVAHK